jgi:hypothetical protein
LNVEEYVDFYIAENINRRNYLFNRLNVILRIFKIKLFVQNLIYLKIISNVRKWFNNIKEKNKQPTKQFVKQAKSKFPSFIIVLITINRTAKTQQPSPSDLQLRKPIVVRKTLKISIKTAFGPPPHILKQSIDKQTGPSQKPLLPKGFSLPLTLIKEQL